MRFPNDVVDAIHSKGLLESTAPEMTSRWVLLRGRAKEWFASARNMVIIFCKATKLNESVFFKYMYTVMIVELSLTFKRLNRADVEWKVYIE